VTVFDHPLIQHKLSLVRQKDTSFRGFRKLIGEIAGLMVYEATRAFPTKEVCIETPMERTTARVLAGTITVVPILRAGLGMAEGILDVMPEARVGHLGLHRDEKTLNPITYLKRLPPNLSEGPVILVDPMLATGGTLSAAIDMLRAEGAEDLRMICLVAAPEGVSRLTRAHPDLHIYTAALDRCLNERGFILPGLGDAGDRMYGTL
jgi:uracil phosphoribosyltransferase